MAGDKDGPTVINTGSGSGAAGWFLAALVLVVVLVGGYFLINNNGKIGGGDTVGVTIETPKTNAPTAPAPEPKTN